MVFIPLALLFASLSDGCSPTPFGGADTGAWDEGTWEDTGTAWGPPAVTSTRLAWTGGAGVVSEGFAYRDDEDAWVGMGSVTCLLDPYGVIQNDVDPIDHGSEGVTDSEEVVVVVSGDDLAVLDRDEGLVVVEHHVPGLVDAEDDGRGDTVALAHDPEHGCVVVFFDGRTRTLVKVPGDGCDAREGFAFDPATGTAWVASDAGVFAVTRGGATDLGLDGDLVAWDAADGVLYVAKEGGQVLTAAEADGTVITEVDMGAPIARLEPAGQTGGVLVGTRPAPGDLEIVHVDARAGHAGHLATVHADVRQFALSPGGRRFAVLTADRIDLYEVAQPRPSSVFAPLD